MWILFIIASLTWHVEEFTIPVKYKEIFSDLSDVTIPLETLSIGMELGEGNFISASKSTYYCQVTYT